MEAFVKLRIFSLILLLSFSSMVFPAEQAKNPIISIVVFCQKLATNLGMSGTKSSISVGLGSLATASVFLLPKWSAEKQKKLDQEFRSAFLSNASLEKIKTLLAQGPKINKRFQGFPLLIWAVDCNKHDPKKAFELIDLLLNHGAKINRTSITESTVLTHTIGHQFPISYTDLLLQRGARVKDELCLAAQLGKSDLIMLLIKHKADVNKLQDQSAGTARLTPLMHAARNGKTDALRLLLSNNAAINIKDHHGNTALMHAVQAGLGYCTRELLRQGADSALKNNNQMTPQKLVLHSMNTHTARIIQNEINKYRDQLRTQLYPFLRECDCLVILFLMEDPKEFALRRITSNADADAKEEAEQRAAEDFWDDI